MLTKTWRSKAKRWRKPSHSKTTFPALSPSALDGFKNQLTSTSPLLTVCFFSSFKSQSLILSHSSSFPPTHPNSNCTLTPVTQHCHTQSCTFRQANLAIHTKLKTHAHTHAHTPANPEQSNPVNQINAPVFGLSKACDTRTAVSYYLP